MQRLRFCVILVTAMVVPLAASAKPARTSAANPSAAKAADTISEADYYDYILKRITAAGGIPLQQVDFGRLRHSFFVKYGSRSARPATIDAFNRAMAEGACEVAVRRADTILSADFADINAHIYKADCHRQLGQTDLQNFHMAFGTGLIRSIVNGRDGRSAAAAFVVYQPAEEAAVMGYLGLAAGAQETHDNGKRVYDVLVCKDKQGGEIKLYFDVTEWRKRAGPQGE
jgi:hypothetical protein